MKKENRSMAGKILKILDIMRDGEEFYLEEAKGVLASLLVEIARINRDSAKNVTAKAEESHGYDLQVPGLYF